MTPQKKKPSVLVSFATFSNNNYSHHSKALTISIKKMGLQLTKNNNKKRKKKKKKKQKKMIIMVRYVSSNEHYKNHE